MQPFKSHWVKVKPLVQRAGKTVLRTGPLVPMVRYESIKYRVSDRIILWNADMVYLRMNPRLKGVFIPFTTE